eukprot:scaffold40670_cov63-Phaeocystis_antarctica.AAC.3
MQANSKKQQMRSKFTPKAEAHESNVGTNCDASRQWYRQYPCAADGSPVLQWECHHGQAVTTGPPTEARRCDPPAGGLEREVDHVAVERWC